MALCGATAIGLYILSVAWISSLVPVRLLYNGQPPPLPYNWVVPLPYLASTNIRPSSGAGSVPIGMQPGSVTTGDAQAVVIFPEGAVEPRTGESATEVTLTPLDPGTVTPVPQGLRFDGNAYRVEGRYSGSKEPIALRRPATIVLRYPIHATTVLVAADSGWTALPTETVPATLQIFAQVNRLGVFVAAAPATARPPGLPIMAWWAYTTSALGMTLALAGRLRRQRRAGF